jgi:hypothetical protein
MKDVTNIAALLTASQRESYLNRLRRQAAELQAKRDAEAASTMFDPRAKLKAQITAWYDALGPEDRAPNYLMEDLARRLRATPQQLGVALRELGWRCERRWRKGESYRHYWIPPTPDSTQNFTSRPSGSYWN